MDTLLVAQKIFHKLQMSTSPSQSSWGEKHQQAHYDLFTYFKDDMIDDIRSILEVELHKEKMDVCSNTLWGKMGYARSNT